MNLPCLFVPNELSDEAAACVAELLLNLAHAFDSQYATQICRHSNGTNPLGQRRNFRTPVI